VWDPLHPTRIALLCPHNSSFPFFFSFFSPEIHSNLHYDGSARAGWLSSRRRASFPAASFATGERRQHGLRSPAEGTTTRVRGDGPGELRQCGRGGELRGACPGQIPVAAALGTLCRPNSSGGEQPWRQAGSRRSLFSF
jgi:hypothetical protein